MNTWQPNWPKESQKDLARYVMPMEASKAAALKFPFNPLDSLNTPEGRTKIVRTIYDLLKNRQPAVQYAFEEYTSNQKLQVIRSPREILNEVNPKGTCLDLSIFFCGLCLDNRLLPTLILLNGHAFVAVSLQHILVDDGESAWRSFNPDRNRVNDSKGMMAGPEGQTFLRDVLQSGKYLFVECTGFSRSETLDVNMPEGRMRIDGLLDFERACIAGQEHITGNDREFLYALDITYLQYGAGLEPYEIPLDKEVVKIDMSGATLKGRSKMIGYVRNMIDRKDNPGNEQEK